MEDIKMKLKNKIKTIKLRKMINKNWLNFPFFLIVSFLLYSFVIVKDNIPGQFKLIPDSKDSIATVQPKIDIKVNKKYDESGNLIQYDSSYSIIYSSPNSTIQFYNFENDSLFSQLKNSMNEKNSFKDDFFKDFEPFGLNKELFQINPMIDFKEIQEMMNQLRQYQKNDSNFVQPQNFKLPQKKSSTPHMITL